MTPKMNRYELPSLRFPYKIKYRINMLSKPRRQFESSIKSLAFTPNGVRMSALRGQLTDRVHEASYPYVRRLLNTRRTVKSRFTPERMERFDRLIEAANATIYAKLANFVIDLKKQDNKVDKKKRGWTDTEWKKHMDYIDKMSVPRKAWEPPEVERGPSKPLSQMMDDINRLAEVPDCKMYRRLSQEEWYRDPLKISPAALKYNISDRMKFLAQPRPNPDLEKDKEKKEE